MPHVARRKRTWYGALVVVVVLTTLGTIVWSKDVASKDIAADVFSTASNETLAKRGLVDPVVLDDADAQVTREQALKAASSYGTPTEVRLLQFRVLDEPAALDGASALTLD
jgi:hypothetical protein